MLLYLSQQTTQQANVTIMQSRQSERIFSSGWGTGQNELETGNHLWPVLHENSPKSCSKTTHNQ
ncbi:hypothetical protein P5673_029739 [Acropora cervicornis]|uniref:Uncharacterized protein n=1 Tax=Acropora cervicornis TaxID=6130 RepID=A0AAD9PVC1_ACRCE|nr:hypothetical protein P5673_029739 [Acropora cervicornis]